MDDAYQQAVPVTPSNTDDIRPGFISDALWIGGAGDGTLSVVMADGKTVAFAAVTTGRLPLAVRRVNSTGTGVTNIVALKR